MIVSTENAYCGGSCVELRAIKTLKIYEEIVEQLKTAILDGRFPPGSKLPSVRDLSQHFSVGQAAVREALTALQAIGWITMKQGDGTFVNQFDPSEISKSVSAVPISKQDITHLLELRKIIETGSVRLAAERRTRDELQKVLVALEKMRADFQEGTIGEEADWQFHYEIANCSGNPFIVSLMDTIGEKIKHAQAESRKHLFQIPGAAERLLNEHERIFTAISNKQTDVAVKEIINHLQHVEDGLQVDVEPS